MTFNLEPLTGKLYDEVLPLLRKHYKEIAHYQDISLEPDVEHYQSAQKQGALRIFTARDDGRLVGYCVFYIRKNPHYKSSKQASQDILFLDPEMRGSMQGFKFIKWCDEQLRDEGTQCVYHHVKMSHNFGPALERMGYKKIDEVYGKRLDGGE